MRIVHLTAGAGKRYCGACLRDTSLVRALLCLGHEATLQTLYLPVHDEEGVEAEGRIGMGGIATWLAANGPVLDKLAAPLEGVLGSRGILRVAARLGEMTEPSSLGPMTHATLRVEGKAMSALCERVVQDIAALKPQAVLLSNALLLGFAPLLKRATGAAVICTLQSESDFIEDLSDPWPDRVWRTLRELSGAVDGFIAVSRAHRDEMAGRLGLNSALVPVVPHGVPADTYGPMEPPASNRHRRVAYLARLDERHGARRLLEAFSTLPLGATPPTLMLAGSMTSVDRAYVQGLRERITELGLADRVSVHPNISPPDKREMLGQSGVLCVPTTREAAGRYLLEAWASGCAVIAPRVGSLEEWIEDTQGGFLYDSGSEPDLARALRTVCEDEGLTTRLAEAGAAAVNDRYRSEHMARGIINVIERLGDPPPATRHLQSRLQETP